jgi:hypothetical protein
MQKLDIDLIWFGYIACLSHCGRGGYFYSFQIISTCLHCAYRKGGGQPFQIISTCLHCAYRKGGGQHPVTQSICHRSFKTGQQTASAPFSVFFCRSIFCWYLLAVVNVVYVDFRIYNERNKYTEEHEKY